VRSRKNEYSALDAAIEAAKRFWAGILCNTRVQHKGKFCKLQLDEHGVMVKIEVNMVGRGLIGEASKLPLCDAAQEQFNVFCAMPLVPIAQLYGGKICAALDRQHPRDLFDIKLLFENEGITNEIKRGFIFGLVSSSRPTLDLLDPHFLDQRIAFENQFEGMSEIEFSYDE